MGEGDLLDRDHEFDVMRGALADAMASRGRLIVVEGSAGTGKSVLLATMAVQATAAGVRVLQARGSELERDFPFGAVRQLFEREVAGAEPVERARLLADAAAPAAWVVAPRVVGKTAQLGPQYGLAALHGIYWLASNLSQGTPTVLGVDDLHWADRSSIRALAYLAHRIADLSVVLVVTLRPDEPNASTDLINPLLAEPDATSLRLRPLGLSAVRTIVRRSLPDATDAVCEACLEVSSGNPFYLTQLIGTLIREGARDDLLAAVRTAALPGLGGSLIRRLRSLGPPAVALVRVMAVLGGRGQLADAASIAGLGQQAATAIAARLQQLDILETADPFAFVHPLVLHSVYASMSLDERESRHMLAAERFRANGASPQTVAAQLAALRPGRSPVVASWLQSAAHEAVERAAPETAAQWFERALQEDAPSPARAQLLHELGAVQVAARDPAAIGNLRAALELSSVPEDRARTALDLAEILAAAGMWTATLDALGRAGDTTQLQPELSTQVAAFHALIAGYDPLLVHEFDEAEDRLIGLADGESWASRAISVLLAGVWTARGEHATAARKLVAQALRDDVLFSEHGGGGWASAHAIQALLNLGADPAAAAAADQLARCSHRSGALIGQLTSDGYRGWMLARAGDLVEAEAMLRPVTAVAIDNDMGLLIANAAYFLTDALLERSSVDDLGQVFLRIEPEERFSRTGGGALLVELRGRLHILHGEPDLGIAELRRAVETADGLRFGPALTSCRSALALALPGTSRDEALALAGTELALAERTGQARLYGMALRTRGLIGPGDQALGDLAESVRQLETTSAKLELARSLVAYGAALRRHGRRLDARDPLARGRVLAQRCGADRFVAQATEELLATGARPRRIALSGRAALTPSELRTAQLAAEGRSNAQIAQALFVSLKTVETHLTRVYLKLDLTGPRRRSELASTLKGRAV